MVRQLLMGEIPSLRQDVKEATAASKNAQREAFDAKAEATLAKERIEDVRQRVECLEPLQVNGAKREVRLDAVEKRLERTAERRWGIWVLVIGAILGGLGSLGTAIWWARGVESAASHEMQLRQAADEAIADKLSSRPTRDEVLTRGELKALRDELIKNRQPTVDEWISSLPSAKQKAVKRIIGADQAAVQ